MPRIREAIAVALLLSASPGWALPPGFSLQEVHNGLSFSTQLRFAPDGRLFYTELGGRIRVYQNGFSQTATTWATVPVSFVGERGLLSLDFHPAFPDSPYIYVIHSNPSPLEDRIVRLKDQGGIGTGYAVLRTLPSGANNHHGGRLKFGPDGMLYVTVGDQEVPDNAQNPALVNGKVLRLTPMGTAAPGNPYGSGNPAYVVGVRNPFGICFDPANGAGYFTEAGPTCDDEVNYLTPGVDYGWGSDDFCGGQPGGSYPSLHTFGSVVTPVGCCVLRGTGYPGSLIGNLYFAAYNNQTLYRLKFRPGTVDQKDSLVTFATFPFTLLDVTVGPEGYLWVLSTDVIYRILPSPVGVGPSEPRPSTLLAAPNPFRDRLSLEIGDLPPDARIEILDVQGRMVRRWPGPLPQRLEWDGRAGDGRPVAPGVYLVRVRGAGLLMTRRVLRLAG
jgi:glucose/arabinose dehydrogenase